MVEGHTCYEHDNVYFLPSKEVLTKVDLDHHNFFFQYFLSKNRSYNTKDGFLFQSGKYDRLSSKEAQEELTQLAEEK
jgi:hypothetical protein